MLVYVGIMLYAGWCYIKYEWCSSVEGAIISDRVKTKLHQLSKKNMLYAGWCYIKYEWCSSVESSIISD